MPGRIDIVKSGAMIFFISSSTDDLTAFDGSIVHPG
jgi:hypothetical protein